MSVLFNAAELNRWQIKVDDVHDVGDVKASSRDTSSDQNWALASTESSNSILTFALSTVTVDRCAWKVKIEDVIINLITGSLGVDEDYGTGRWLGHQKIIQGLALLGCLNPNNILLYVDVRGASTTYTNADMVMSEMLLGQEASSFWECSREHHVGDVSLLLIC
jgi:hypothetical protein